MPYQALPAPDLVDVAVGNDKEVVGHGGDGVVPSYYIPLLRYIMEERVDAVASKGLRFDAVLGFFFELVSQVSGCLTKVVKGGPYLAAMTTYYFRNPEEALKRAKAAGKRPGCWYGGITFSSGKKGWAIYRDGKVVERYAVMNK